VGVSRKKRKNEEKMSFRKKSSHDASENFLSLPARSSLSLHLFISSSRAFKEDKDGSEDFERKRRRRRREEEEERV
jgi:hypothetical protein